MIDVTSGSGRSRSGAAQFARCISVRFGTAAVALLVLCGFAKRPEVQAEPRLRTLTHAREAHALSVHEAGLGYPIHLQAVVTMFDPYLDPRHDIMFVHDQSGSIFVRLPKNSKAFPAGTLVDIAGKSAMGDYAPILADPQIKAIGTSRLPATAPRVSLTQIATDEFEGQWVQMKGVIHSVRETEHDVFVQLATTDGKVTAILPREPGGEYVNLIDALVTIDANAGLIFNEDRQKIGTRLMVPSLSTVRILEPGPADPFQLPLRHISSLARYGVEPNLPRRIHVRGRVTLFYPGSLLCIRDVAHGLCATTSETSPLATGDEADVVGFAEAGGIAPSLGDAIYRFAKPASPEAAFPAVPNVNTMQALYGAFDSELVRLEGVLIGRDLAAADPTLVLASGGKVFEVVLPRSLGGNATSVWGNGSRVRVTGICSVHVDEVRTVMEGGTAKRQSFRVLLRSPGDIELLEAPSWWTPLHTLMVLAVALSLTLVVLIWVVVLTRRLRRQTRIIQRSEEEFRYLAQHDSLTGLPTRLLLRDRLDRAIEHSKRSGTGLALLMLDLDRFKDINDMIGHLAGDQALKISAHRILATIRASDTVARISGDEFIVLLTDLREPHEAELVAAKVVAALSAPFRLGHREIPLSASVGVCTEFGGHMDVDALLKSVDTAMYHAKAQGRNRFQLYTAAMAQASAEHQRLRTGLERAMAAKELEVHYQPMVSFQTGELTGFEALLRWRSTEHGMIMPGSFIPIAEETGLILPMGEWVLRQACREIGMLEDQLGKSFMLAVNLSPRQIQQPGLPEMVALALSETGRAAHQVELEITESVLMSDSGTTQKALMELQVLGVSLAIDDFGVGFSSLSYITKFAIDRIKIDRSFIRKCMREDGSLAVVRAMVAMAHGLGMTVVAEGVETMAEFHFLRNEGCDTAQGFYLSRPTPFEELPRLVSDLERSALSRRESASHFQAGSDAGELRRTLPTY